MMGDQDDKEKAEKLAAAKKRVAQLKKKKAGATAAKADKVAASSETTGSNEISTANDVADVQSSQEHESDLKASAAQQSEDDKTTTNTTEPIVENAQFGEDADEKAFNEVIAASKSTDDIAAETITQSEPPSDNSTPTVRRHQSRQPSISVQSKIRSTSFRQSVPTSPSQTAEQTSEDSLYRKQASRIEELEKENAHLVKSLDESEIRWRKSEEELEELHEKVADEDTSNNEVARLQSEIDILRRNSRASTQTSALKSSANGAESSIDDAGNMKREMEGKDSIISDLQIELSRLRSQLSAQAQGCEHHGEQITALQSRLTKADSTNERLEAELSDAKKALSRASEKAVADGTEKSSSQTRVNMLQKENERLERSEQDLSQALESLERKIEAMTKIHREAELRNSTKMAGLDAQLHEFIQLKSRTESLERENARLREARKQTMSGEGGDDGLEELEDEDRKRLERRIRELESENFDLRRGIWRDKRRELQPGMVEDAGDDFDDIDLSGSAPVSRRRSTASQGPNRQHSGFTQVLNSGLAAFRSSTISPDSHQKTRPRNDSLLQDFDDDAFDEHEFARLQREEEMKKMVEHVREVKRGLKQWAGWRLDLVDARRGGGGWGVGEVFDI